jgi:hypothetical protein
VYLDSLQSQYYYLCRYSIHVYIYNIYIWCIQAVIQSVTSLLYVKSMGADILDCPKVNCSHTDMVVGGAAGDTVSCSRAVGQAAKCPVCPTQASHMYTGDLILWGGGGTVVWLAQCLFLAASTTILWPDNLVAADDTSSDGYIHCMCWLCDTCTYATDNRQYINASNPCFMVWYKHLILDQSVQSSCQ